MRKPPCFDDADTRQIVDALCRKNKIDIELLADLCELVQDYSGSGRKDGVTTDIDNCIEGFLERSEGGR